MSEQPSITSIVQNFFQEVKDAVEEAKQAEVRLSDLSLNEALIVVAELNGRPIRFRYAKGDGRTIEYRQLTNIQLATSVNGDYLVTGDDPDRDEPRSYRVDRIKGVVSVS